MLVQPNATYPEVVLRNPNGNMVIVNLQKTPYDHLASVRLFCTTDSFMELIMKELNITKFDLKTDCKDKWDTITGDELHECWDRGAADLQKHRFLKGSNMQEDDDSL